MPKPYEKIKTHFVLLVKPILCAIRPIRTKNYEQPLKIKKYKSYVQNKKPALLKGGQNPDFPCGDRNPLAYLGRVQLGVSWHGRSLLATFPAKHALSSASRAYIVAYASNQISQEYENGRQ